MPFRRLGAGHDITCERAYSGYEIANTPVQDAGKDRKVPFEYQTPCTKSKVFNVFIMFVCDHRYSWP
jgi:hypothetical protein